MQEYKPNSGLKSAVRRDPGSLQFDRFGERYSAYRQQWGNATMASYPKDFPMHLDFDLVDACNMQCPLCHQAYRTREAARLTANDIERIFSEAGRYNLYAVNFGASSEPLLAADLLFEAMEAASSAGVMDIFLHTNGLLLSDSIRERLLDSPVSHLCVSLDAVTKETYVKCRGLDVLDNIEQNVLALLDLRETRGKGLPTIRVSFCNNPENFHEKDAFVEKWQDVVDMVEIQNYRDVGGNIDVDVAKHTDTRFECIDPFRRAMIWPSGVMSLCCGYKDEDVLIGSIRENFIHDLWQSEKYQDIRRAFERQQGIPGTCKKCLYSHCDIK